MNLNQIPFDSLVLWAVNQETCRLVGWYVSRIWQVDEWTLVIRFRKAGQEEKLLISCNPRFPRIYFVKTKPDEEEGKLARVLKSKLDNAKLVAVETGGFDRTFFMRFENKGSLWNLIAILFGSHSNIVLTSNDNRIEALARKMKGVRVSSPLQIPIPPASSPEEAILQEKGLSHFLSKVVSSIGRKETWKQIVNGRPIYVVGQGAYPFYPSCVSFDHVEYTSTISEALEKHFAKVIPLAQLSARKQNIKLQLDRVLDSRNAAIRQMEGVLDTATNSMQLQKQGELILANLNNIPEGSRIFEVQDYDGELIAIRLDPTKSPLENAERLFKKAKHAKRASEEVSVQYARMKQDVNLILKYKQQLESADPLLLDEIEGAARQNGWFKTQSKTESITSERKFRGYRIRELQVPGGFTIIVGENAAANDYIVSRLAKPNDYWFHVRGARGSHVILQTNNKPEKVQRITLEFTARIAAKNSSQKHAKWVPVDYTLVKYVRKPRKSAPGVVTYSHEKTIQLDTTE